MRTMKLLLTISIIFNIIGAGIILYVGMMKYRQITSPNATDLRRENKKDVFSVLNNEYNDIIFLGDNYIERCHWSELLNNCRIRNRGIGGENVKGLLSRIEDITRIQPAQIFIMVGLNDIIANKS